MSERRSPVTLEEAYLLRDSADNLDERDFYQERVYRLRRADYRRRGIPTDSSARRRSAIEFSREVFFLEVAGIAGRQSPGGEERAREEARRHAVRLDTHASLKQPASPHAVERYRRNFLELLRAGKSAGEAYYLSRVVGPVADAEFRSALESVRRTGYPGGRTAYVVERAVIRVRDLPGGMVFILLTFFASLFALVWASNDFRDGTDAGTILFVAPGLVAAGGFMLISAVFIAAAVRSINK